MYYLDTSILLALTLTKSTEPERHRAVSDLFEFIGASKIKAVTSFYALHELLIIALINTQPDGQTGSELARYPELIVGVASATSSHAQGSRSILAGPGIPASLSCGRK